MTLKPWQYTGSTELADVKIFKLLRETAVSPRNGSERSYARIVGPEWVNVIAVTAERELLLVRQWRHGVRGFRLEIPGGLVDPGEEPATAAARRLWIPMRRLESCTTAGMLQHRFFQMSCQSRYGCLQSHPTRCQPGTLAASCRQ